MRKYFTPIIFILIIHFSQLVHAQTIPVSGTVLAPDNSPIVGATVLLKGKRTGTKSDANGAFTINAAKGDVLIISSVGHVTQQVKVGSSSPSITLQNGDNVLDEVVITAMDIRRNPKELGYSAPTVKGSEIEGTQRENFVNSLQGRVAGLTVTPTSGVAGASSGIVLRGFNTLSGTNQPLFILDGVLVDNQTLNENSSGGSGIGLASDLPNRNNDYTNRIADLNPSDIESVTILKGPEATALYGSQANSGAIVITTKKAKSTGGKLLVNYQDNFRIQRITRFANVNETYGPGGSNGIPTAPPLVGQFTSYGPAFPADTKMYDNLHHFFRTGFTQTHNLGLEFGTKNVGFRASGQYIDDNGVVPFNSYQKYNFKLSNNTKLGKYITITPSINYIHSDNVKPQKGFSGYLLDLYAWPANNDIRNYQDAKGNKNLLYNSYNTDIDNPLWSAKNNKTGDKTDRVIGTLGVNINPFDWLALSGRFGYDTYKTDGYLFTHPESNLLGFSTGGSLDNYYRKYTGYNHTITATFKKSIHDFSARLLVGTMWQDFETKQFGVAGSHLIDSTSTDSSNTLVGSRTRLLRNYRGLPNLNIIRELAFLGEAFLSYKDEIFLTYSQRFEQASPLPASSRNYNYPGASLSMIISDIFPILKRGTFLNYLKLRGSLASTARLNDPYANQSVFTNNQSSSTVPGFTYGFVNANPNLVPEKQNTYEIGTEIRMFNNAVSLEGNYYNTLCTDQINQLARASYATGFVLNTFNASSLRNEGVEVSLDIMPIKKKDFDWDIRFNYNHMWSKVLSLPLSIGLKNDYYNSDTYLAGNVRGGLVRGYSTGTITGFGYQRNNAGQILVSPTTGLGLVEAINYVRGDRTPKFTLGTLNTFRYKNWNLSFLWDLKVGGDIFNGTEQYLTNLGKSARTADRKTPIVVQGVLNDGFQNTDHPTANTIVVNPYYTSAYYTNLPDEEFIQHDVNWLRFRDITLSYSLKGNILKKLKSFRSLSFFVTGNDLVLITNYSGADPAVNANNPGTGGVGAYGFDYGSPPTPLSLSFGLRANFK